MQAHTLVSLAALALLLWAGASRGQDVSSTLQPGRVSVYYFGNNLTGSTAPELHTALGKSAGKEWAWEPMAVAGGQLWQYRDQFQLDAKLENVADYTINPEIAKSAPYFAQRFLQGHWDAIVLQPFATKMTLVQNEMWGRKYDAPRDFGDLAAAKYLIDLALTKNPDCRVFICQDWPGMHIADGSSGHAGAGLGKTGKELNHRQMEPIRRSFDFPREWLRRYDPDAVPWQAGAQSRDYEWRLMDRSIEAYPALWQQGRLRMIPAGDIHYALDRKMRAGQVPGLVNLGEFYTDTLHHRAGMPAYTCAASFYTLLFGENPDGSRRRSPDLAETADRRSPTGQETCGQSGAGSGDPRTAEPQGLDYTLYNKQAAYDKDWGHDKDQHNDSGEVLEITPERAQAVHDTIWEVVHAHPYTRFAKDGSKETLARLEAGIPVPEPIRVSEYGRLAGWSAMPFWQAALDRTAGRHSAWMPVLDLTPWSQTWASQWLAGVFRDKKHPYGFREYSIEMDEPYREPAVRHQGLCLQVGSPTDEEIEGFVSLARRFCQHHSEAFVLGYFAWPAIPEAAALGGPDPAHGLAALRYCCFASRRIAQLRSG